MVISCPAAMLRNEIRIDAIELPGKTRTGKISTTANISVASVARGSGLTVFSGAGFGLCSGGFMAIGAVTVGDGSGVGVGAGRGEGEGVGLGAGVGGST